MPFTPVFQLVDRGDRVHGEDIINKTVVASRKLLDGSITGRLFSPVVRLQADILSNNWDGADPVDLSSVADATATLGYALDASAGAIQVQTLYAEGGQIGNLTVVSNLTLETGGVFRTASSGERIEISKTDLDRVAFYTGDNFEAEHAAIRHRIAGTDGTTRQLGISLFAPTTTGDTFATQFHLLSESEDDSSLPPQVLVQYGGGSSQIPELKLTNSFKLMLEDGTVSLPSLTFNSDADTGLYRAGTNQVALAGAGKESFKSNGTTVWLLPVYTDTSGTAADVSVGSDGRLRRSTSARKYKSRINYNMDHLADIDLRPAKFYRKDDKAWYIGFIADDLGDQEPLLGAYEDGEIANYDLRSVVAVLAAKANRLERLVGV